MPSIAMTVPYMRTSPIHIPRRDLVLADADSMFLRVTVIDQDNSCAQAIQITSGIGTPSAQLTVWAYAPGLVLYCGYYYDYGWPLRVNQKILWTGIGATSGALGAFDFSFPSGTMSTWPRRCGWSVQLNYDTQGSEVLMLGSLHLRFGGAQPFALPETAIQTDTYVPITTDIEEPVLA